MREERIGLPDAWVQRNSGDCCTRYEGGVLLRSLVENMARRTPSCLALNEIERLMAAEYSNVEIGKKLELPDTTARGYLRLKRAGEERLLDGRNCAG